MTNGGLGMKRVAMLAARADACCSWPALAGAPTAAQQEKFQAECLRNSGGNTTLCTCKSEQVMKLADEAFMEVILATMQGKPLPEAQSRPYGVYISRSNAVCAPGM